MKLNIKQSYVKYIQYYLSNNYENQKQKKYI